MCGIATCFTTSHHVIVIFLESPARRGGHRLRRIVNHVVWQWYMYHHLPQDLVHLDMHCHHLWLQHFYLPGFPKSHTTLVGMIISIMRACHMYYMSYSNHVTKIMHMALYDRSLGHRMRARARKCAHISPIPVQEMHTGKGKFHLVDTRKRQV